MSDRKNLAEHQSAQTDDRVLGSTRRRFGNNFVFRDPLMVADPSTYRPGVGALFDSLLRMNRYEFQQTHYRDEEERIAEILQIVAEHPTFCDERLPCLWAIRSFQMLGRLEELPVEPIVEFLLDLQRADGGFVGVMDDNRSSMMRTAETLSVLSSLGREPKNASAVQSFVAGLQRPNYTYLSGFCQGFFAKRYPEPGESGDPDCFIGTTDQALHILQLLGAPVPHRDILARTTNKWLKERFLASWERNDLSHLSTYEPIVDSLTITLGTLVALANGLGNQSLLSELRSYAWHLHQLASEKKLEEGYMGFNDALAILGKAAFPPRTYLSPGTVSLSKKGGSLSFQLQLENPTPLQFLLRLKDLSLVDWVGKSFCEGLPTGTVVLPPFGSAAFPVQLTYPSANASTESLPSTVTFRLTADRLTYGHVGSIWLSEAWLTSEVFFELPVKRNLSPVALGLLIGLPVAGGIAGGTAVALRYHRRRRRRQKDYSSSSRKRD